MIDLGRIFDIEGESLAFERQLDLSQVSQWGQRPFQSPVKVTGSVENRAGIVTLRCEASFVLTTICDRCLTQSDRPTVSRFEHVLARELNDEDNDDFIVVKDGLLDLDQLVTSDTLLELPIKALCREDCKGLCPICGANLNETTCGCGKQSIDPRLQVLQDLLNNQN